MQMARQECTGILERDERYAGLGLVQSLHSAVATPAAAPLNYFLLLSLAIFPAIRWTSASDIIF